MLPFSLVFSLLQLFSSPIDVDTVGRAAVLAANGLVTRDLVNAGQPRKQGFYNTSGLPVEYDNILFVDGTHEIEAFVDKFPQPSKQDRKQSHLSSKSSPLWEGALIGKKPYLFPIPVALFFATFFWAVVTEQFVRRPM